MTIARLDCTAFPNGLLPAESRVALARRLAVIMHAMLRDGAEFKAA